MPAEPTAEGARAPSASLTFDARTLALLVAMFAGFGVGGGATTLAAGGRLPDEARSQLAQVPAAASSAAAAADAAKNAAASASVAATAATQGNEAIAQLGRQLVELKTAITKMEERASFSDKERERLERTVAEHEVRLRALEQARR